VLLTLASLCWRWLATRNQRGKIIPYGTSSALPKAKKGEKNMKKIKTLEEAIKCIQELENKTKEFDKIRELFNELRYGGIDEFDFSDQVILILENC